MRCSKKHQQLLGIPSILTTQPLTAESQRRSSPSTREPNSETGSQAHRGLRRPHRLRRPREAVELGDAHEGLDSMKIEWAESHFHSLSQLSRVMWYQNRSVPST